MESNLGSKDASRLHLNATNGKALTLEYLYNLPNSGFRATRGGTVPHD